MLTFSADPNVAERQMNAIIFYMTAFGYIDGNFDRREKTFVRSYIQRLIAARAENAMPGADPRTRDEVVARFTTHFHEVLDQLDAEVQDLFHEVVAGEENIETFVHSRLKLRCYEIFHGFDASNQHELLRTVDDLIHADGHVHEAEAQFRAELQALLEAEIPLALGDIEIVADPANIAAPAVKPTRVENHPFFFGFEQHYSSDPERLRQQAERDLVLMNRFIVCLAEQRARGTGRLSGVSQVSEVQGKAPFLDGHVHVHPVVAGRTYELTVLGDLHGCYSCLKAAVLQADFFAKLEAWKLNPGSLAEPKLVLLGDYIDRGRFSYNGVLRAVMELFVAAPEHVFVLRGNHEYYIEFNGRVYGGVKPAEAINTLVGHMPDEIFSAYMNLFEEMSSMLLFGDVLFVHAGIPRDADLAKRWRDLSSLNDPELRFQMMWSDPSSADFIPHELQEQNARFPFGRLQFDAFMRRIGCSMMIRGHEKIDEGFRNNYPGNSISLLTLFSSGGADNDDLPEESGYRSVTPMACTVAIDGGGARVTPWAIDYQRYNDPARNRFFASEPEIDHKIA